MTIVISGGGIAGLTLANFLEGTPHEVIIVEKSPRFLPVGYVVGLWSNGISVLKDLQLYSHFKTRAFLAESQETLDVRGRLLRRTDFTRLNEKFDGAIRFIHRADLHSVLVERLRKSKVITGTSITAISQNADRVEITLDNGTSLRADWLIGGDGIHSAVRDLAFPGSQAVLKHKALFYTFIHSVGDGDPALTGNVELIGNGRVWGVYPFSAERRGVFASVSTSVPLPGEKYEQLHHHFQEFGSPVREMLKSVTYKTDIFSDWIKEVEIPSWSTNRVILIGDAAHALLPTTGQGVSAAMEDAKILFEMMFRNPVQGSSESRLTDFQRVRTAKLQPLRSSSRINNFVMMNRNPLLCFIRNQFLKHLPTSERKLEKFFSTE